jgi:hypothetical protein
VFLVGGVDGVVLGAVAVLGSDLACILCMSGVILLRRYFILPHAGRDG